MAYIGAGLPGQIMQGKPMPGLECEMCPDTRKTKAETIMRGETDSFGSEYLALCTPCCEKRQKEQHEGQCDWCKDQSQELRYTRDPDEGYHGPVYRICPKCDKKLNEYIATM